jgi:hypothetical protein
MVLFHFCEISPKCEEKEKKAVTCTKALLSKNLKKLKKKTRVWDPVSSNLERMIL